MEPEQGGGASPAPSETTSTSSAPESSPAPVEQQASQPEQGAAPTVSTEQKDAPPKSALDAVMQGMERERKDAAQKAAQNPGTTEQQQQPAPETKADAQPAEGGEKQQQQPHRPKDANTRIRELVGVNKQLAPRAKNWDDFAGWVSNNGLTQEDVQEGLELMRLMRQNPAEAAKRMQPMIDYVRQFTGEALPADVQQMLDEGRIDERAARELAARRTQDSFRQQQDAEANQRAREQQELQQRQQQVQRLAQAVNTSVAQWETQWRTSDPDYAKKQPLVSRAISHLIVERGAPTTPQAAVELAKLARQEVEQQLASMLPQQRSVNTPTGGSSQPTVTAPRSSLEAAKRGLAATP